MSSVNDPNNLKGMLGILINDKDLNLDALEQSIINGTDIKPQEQTNVVEEYNREIEDIMSSITTNTRQKYRSQRDEEEKDAARDAADDLSTDLNELRGVGLDVAERAVEGVSEGTLTRERSRSLFARGEDPAPVVGRFELELVLEANLEATIGTRRHQQRRQGGARRRAFAHDRRARFRRAQRAEASVDSRKPVVAHSLGDRRQITCERLHFTE